MRSLVVRSHAKRRALAVATSEGSGGGGERVVVRLVRSEEEGQGRCCDVIWVRRRVVRSIGVNACEVEVSS